MRPKPFIDTMWYRGTAWTKIASALSSLASSTPSSSASCAAADPSVAIRIRFMVRPPFGSVLTQGWAGARDRASAPTPIALSTSPQLDERSHGAGDDEFLTGGDHENADGRARARDIRIRG